jgi:hypothetical protein
MKSDIFSLGCVYCEILATLEPQMLPPDLLLTCYAENIENVQRLLKRARFFGPFSYIISVACDRMLERINSERLTAEDLVLCLDEMEKIQRIYDPRNSTNWCDQCKHGLSRHNYEAEKFNRFEFGTTSTLIYIVLPGKKGNTLACFRGICISKKHQGERKEVKSSCRYRACCYQAAGLKSLEI